MAASSPLSCQKNLFPYLPASRDQNVCGELVGKFHATAAVEPFEQGWAWQLAWLIRRSCGSKQRMLSLSPRQRYLGAAAMQHYSLRDPSSLHIVPGVKPLSQPTHITEMHAAGRGEQPLRLVRRHSGL